MERGFLKTYLLGGNRYQGPIVSLKNFGNRGADSLASVRRHRATHISRFSIIAAPIVTPVIDVVVPVDSGGTVGGIDRGGDRGGARGNRTRCRLSHNVVHLLDFPLDRSKGKGRILERFIARYQTRSSFIEGET